MVHTGQTSHDIFVSYKREDEREVRAICEDLRLRGVRPIWMDARELEPGDLWKLECEKAIQASSHVLVMVSRLALASPEVTFEYELADKMEKVVVPVMLDETVLFSELPAPLRKFNGVSLTRHDDYLAGVVQLARKLPRFVCTPPEMICIPAGEFIMGGPTEERSVYLPDFWMGKWVITVTQFSQFVQAGGLSHASYWPDNVPEEWVSSIGRSQNWPASSLDDFSLRHPRQPMYGLTWWQAFAYCQWLNAVLDTPFVYHIPSEAQWEKAARGQTGHAYPWGSSWLPSVANTVEEGRTGPVDCGSLGHGGDSPYGCQDMSGNIWEWTLSRPLPLPYTVNDGREDTRHVSDPRVIRGGSWAYPRSVARTYSRASEYPSPDLYRREIGLRVAATRTVATQVGH